MRKGSRSKSAVECWGVGTGWRVLYKSGKYVIGRV